MCILKAEEGKQLHSGLVVFDHFYVSGSNLWLHDLSHCNPKEARVGLCSPVAIK